jgi:hypothetical protein
LRENVKGEVDGDGSFFFRYFLAKKDVDARLSLFGGSWSEHGIIYRLDELGLVRGIQIWIANL